MQAAISDDGHRGSECIKRQGFVCVMLRNNNAILTYKPHLFTTPPTIRVIYFQSFDSVANQTDHERNESFFFLAAYPAGTSAVQRQVDARGHPMNILHWIPQQPPPIVVFEYTLLD